MNSHCTSYYTLSLYQSINCAVFYDTSLFLIEQLLITASLIYLGLCEYVSICLCLYLCVYMCKYVDIYICSFYLYVCSYHSINNLLFYSVITLLLPLPDRRGLFPLLSDRGTSTPLISSSPERILSEIKDQNGPLIKIWRDDIMSIIPPKWSCICLCCWTRRTWTGSISRCMIRLIN